MAHNKIKLPVECDAEYCREDAVWILAMSGYPGDFRLACDNPEHIALFTSKAWTAERIHGPSDEDEEESA